MHGDAGISPARCPAFPSAAREDQHRNYLGNPRPVPDAAIAVVGRAVLCSGRNRRARGLIVAKLELERIAEGCGAGKGFRAKCPDQLGWSAPEPARHALRGRISTPEDFCATVHGTT